VTSDLLHTAGRIAVGHRAGELSARGASGNDMKARQANKSEEDGHSEFREHVDEILKLLFNASSWRLADLNFLGGISFYTRGTINCSTGNRILTR